MKTKDIIKPVCKGFVCGSLLAILLKPIKLTIRIGKW